MESLHLFANYNNRPVLHHHRTLSCLHIHTLFSRDTSNPLKYVLIFNIRFSSIVLNYLTQIYVDYVTL
jgi:hypothetical protein